MICVDGSQYDGSWEMDRFLSGTVKITYENGDQYEGGWFDGTRNNTGTMIYANGDRYEGEWLLDKKCGTGTMFYADGTRYEGEWSMDQRDGAGTMTYTNGMKLTANKWLVNMFFTVVTVTVTLPYVSQHKPIWIDGKLFFDGY